MGSTVMFVASLPTWNQSVDIYRVRPAVVGNTFRGTIDAQIYCGPKRVNLDFEDAPSLNYMLYPVGTGITLYPPSVPQSGTPTDSLSLVVFEWEDSPYEDGLCYALVIITGPRFGFFPNAHNCAVISMVSWEQKLLWFGASMEVTWVGAGDEDCADCDDLALAYTLDQPWINGKSTALFAWSCADGGQARWYQSYNSALPKVAVGLRDFSGTVIVEYSDASTWDEVTPIALPLTFELDAGLCDFPASVTLTPL